MFTINYRTDITTAHVVRYKGVLYDITRVDTFEGYKEDLTLYCSRRQDRTDVKSKYHVYRI